MAQKIVAAVGGSVGHEPFNPRTWSGVALHFFTAMREQSLLLRAFGAEISPLHRLYFLAKNFRFSRTAWRKCYYLNPGYRQSLTGAMLEQIRSDDYAHVFLQIGAMFSLPSVLRGRAKCMSYHDGNILESLASGYGMECVPQRTVDAAIEYERELAHSVDLVLTMSEYLRQSFIHGFGIPAHRVVNVGGGINQMSIPEIPADKDYDSAEVLFVGVEFERKGGKQLLKAFSNLVQQFPRAKLHVVGPASVTIPPGLKRSVILHGFLRKSDPQEAAVLQELYKRCALVVLPSLYEPFGIALLEAMVHGLACVGTNGWALREIVRPGINGQLVERGNVDDLVDKMVGLLSSPEEIRRMGQAGRHIVVNEYTWSAVVKRVRDATVGLALG
jgi:starch synthase